MKFKLSRLVGLGLFMFVVLVAASIANPKAAYAAGTSRYDPHPNDVAIFGNNSAIQAPTAHFLIQASGTNANVTIENACVDSTAGGQGLSATVSGDTRSYPGDCGRGPGCANTDICFYNVPNNSVLRVEKINGQGHQPFDVLATARTAGGDVLVTQRPNPGSDSGGYGNEGDNYGVNVWMGQTTDFSMDVPCSASPMNGSGVFFKWKDADVGLYNQPGHLQIWWGITNSDFGNVHAFRKIDVGDVGGNNQESWWHLPSDVDVLPGDHIVWRWEDPNWTGHSHNVIQHVLPFSQILNQPSCFQPAVQARCTVTASNSNPIAGSNITVTLTVRNNGAGQWPSAVTVTGSGNHNPGRLNPGQTQTFTDTFTRGSPGGVSYVYHVMDGAATLATCSTFVTWRSQVRITDSSCGLLQISNPGSITFRLRFVDTTTNTEAAVSPVYPQPFSIPPQTSYSYNLFVSFPFMVPHHTYLIEAWNNTLTATYDSSYVNGNRPCMSASCVGTINANTEPGQPFTASYGIRIFNATGRTFDPGAYDAYAVATPGLYLTGANTSTGPLTANANTDYTGPWALRADFGGTLTVYLRYGGSDIGGGVFNGAAYPCQQNYNPQTRATMRVTHGDISTGGGFQYNNSCATNFSNSKPRYVSPFTTTNDTAAGGLRTFSIPQNFQGSGSDFAAYALGYITGTAPGNDGFFTAASKTGIKTYNDLMFANTPAPPGNNLGGLLGGDSMAAHCAVDYFMGTRINDLGTPQNSGQITLNGKATGQYLYKDNGGGLPCLRIKGQVDPGARITIYTDDDVCINDNISYSNWSIDTTNLTNTAPYLTVITRGSIYVQSNVVNIAGLFIAQSDDDGAGNVTGGVFASCANGAAVANSAYLKGNCHSQLTVNGSVIAQRVYPLRATGGTLFNNTGTAETFDYAPSMIIGQPNLKPLCEGAAVDLCKETESNLPPVF
jgi:plastocyanin